MKPSTVAFTAALVAVFALAGLWLDEHLVRPAPAPADRSAEVRALRDSLRRTDSARAADVQVWALQVGRASHDSLAAWLRARAARPLPARIDSILVHDTVEVLAEDSGSSQPAPPVCIEAAEARRLLLRDSALVGLGDSLHGVVRLDSVRLDSVRALVVPRTIPWSAYGIGFGAGVVAGLLTCIAL